MLTSTQIQAILPQRAPLLMIDGVAELDHDHVRAYKDVQADEPLFHGHFPGHPIMPGVLIVEGLAQAGALLAYHVGDYDPARELLLFMTIESARFRRAVRPGDRLDLEVRAPRRGKLWRLLGVASVGGEVAAEAELLAAIRSRDSVTGAGLEETP